MGQGMCVIGYCVFPLLIASILLHLLSTITTHLVLRLLVVAAGYGWSLYGKIPYLISSLLSNQTVHLQNTQRQQQKRHLLKHPPAKCHHILHSLTYSIIRVPTRERATEYHGEAQGNDPVPRIPLLHCHRMARSQRRSCALTCAQ